MSSFCINCGKELSDEAGFCPSCGTKVEIPRCPNCEKEIEFGATFCMYCGQKMEETSDRAAVPNHFIQKNSETELTITPVDEGETQLRQSPANDSSSGKYVHEGIAELEVQKFHGDTDSPIHNSISSGSGADDRSPAKLKTDLAEIIQKNAEYYLPQFEKIRAGEKGDFNWACFFLGGAFCYYRKSSGIFWKRYQYFYALYAGLFLGMIVNTILVLSDISDISRSLLPFGILCGLAALAVNVYGAICAIKLAKSFNREYYKLCTERMNNPELHKSQKGVSVGKGILFLVILWLCISVLVAGCIAVLTTAATHSVMNGFKTYGLDELGEYVGEDFFSVGEMGNTAASQENNMNALDAYIGTWFATTIDDEHNFDMQKYSEQSDEYLQIFGVMLEIQKSSRGYFAYLSTSLDPDGWFAERKRNGDSALPIAEIEDGKWVMAYDLENGDGGYIGESVLYLTINLAGDLFVEVTGTEECAYTPLYYINEWQNGRYRYYEQEESVELFGSDFVDYNTPIDCEMFLRERFYTKWKSGNSLYMPGNIYVVAYTADLYRGTNECLYFYEEGDMNTLHHAQFSDYADGEMTLDDVVYIDLYDHAVSYDVNSLQYFIENCHAQYFSRSDIEGFDAEMSRIAINAVYAHAGRMFQKEEYQTYFSQYDWYCPLVEADAFTASMLNEYQAANLELILAYESEMGYS